jgi:hypothetical protein
MKGHSHLSQSPSYKLGQLYVPLSLGCFCVPNGQCLEQDKLRDCQVTLWCYEGALTFVPVSLLQIGPTICTSSLGVFLKLNSPSEHRENLGDEEQMMW